MKELYKMRHWIAGLQWLFFIFANIVVIPITIGEAFKLSQETIVVLMQFSFMVTGLACLFQVILGHKRPIMEGQSGLWWGIILTLVVTTSAQGMPLDVLGGSFTVGVLISAGITILIGITGLGPKIAKLFNPSVMGVFIFLLGCTLIQIFLKGMLGIPFGYAADTARFDLSISLLSIIIVVLVIIISVKFPIKIRSYSLLIGILLGWILHTIFFGSSSGGTSVDSLSFMLFPLGTPTWNLGVILTVVLAGLLNTANTFGALKGTESILQTKTSKKEYARSFTITGLFTGVAGIFGLVPYTSYISTIGFLRQTNILDRLPFILGSVMFFIMGVFPTIGYFFSLLPLSVGSAVMFVAYLQLLLSALDYFKQVLLNSLNIYRVAIPLFIGIMIMSFPATYFESLPSFVRPFLSNGLLVGILMALVLENTIKWDKFGESSKERTS